MGISRADLAWALDITPQRIGQLAAEPVDPACLRAARLQIVLHDLAQTHREQPTAR